MAGSGVHNARTLIEFHIISKHRWHRAVEKGVLEL